MIDSLDQPRLNRRDKVDALPLHPVGKLHAEIEE